MDPRTVFENKESLRMIDVREQHEWHAGHVEGSEHIPMQELPDHLARIERDRPLVAICRSGIRSAHVVAFMRQQGFDIENLDGGLKAWVLAGLPLTSPDGGPARVV